MTRKVYRFVYLLFLFSLGAGTLWAQGGDPEQDCADAIPVCQQSYSQPNSYVGEGSDQEEINPGTSCLSSGEKNGVWYVMTITQSGFMSFTINPNDAFDDYDWAVYNMTNANCADIYNDPSLEVSCNFSGTSGMTGATGGSGDDSQGAGGTPENAMIPVQAGQTYYVYISNYSSSQSGYDLDFGGTAGIFDNVPPTMSAIAQPIPCNATEITLTFSENIKCNTVQSNDFSITGPDGVVHNVTAATGANCDPNNPDSFDDTFTLTFSPPASSGGTYTLNLPGSVTDLCGNPSVQGSLSFSLDGGTLTMVTPDTLICLNPGASVQAFMIKASFEGDTVPTYSWEPSNSIISGANTKTPTIKPSQTTTYTLTATIPGAQCPIAPITFTATVFQTLPVTVSGDLQLCLGEGTTLTASASGATFTWSPGGEPTASIDVMPQQTTTYTVTPQFGECPGVAKEVTVVVTPLPSSDFILPPFACQNKLSTITYAGPDSLNGTLFQWDFADGVVVSNSGNAWGPYKVFWPTIGLKTVSVTASIGTCQTSTTKTVLVKPTPVVSAGTANGGAGRRCSSDPGVELSGQLLADGGAGSCTFKWSPEIGLNNAFDLGPIAAPANTTMYSLVADCDGCTSDPATVLVSVYPNPFLTLNASGSSFAFCAGSGGVQIDTDVTGGTGSIGYAWTPAAGLDSVFAADPKANPTATTPYAVVATDSMGCASDTLNLIVVVNPVPVSDAGPDLFLCVGGPGGFLHGTVVGDDPAKYDFLWSPALGLNDPTLADPYATPDQTTIYTLTVTDKLTGCSSVPTNLDTLHTTTVYVAPLPQVFAGPDQTICPGDTISIGDYSWNAGPSQTFYWTPAAGLDYPFIRRPKASPAYTTTYFMKVVYHFSSKDSCESVADSIVVTVKERPTVAMLQPVAQLCAGDSVLLPGSFTGGVAPYKYRWEPPTGLSDPTVLQPKASPKQTTTYTLFISAAGCESQKGDSIIVQVSQNPVIKFTANIMGGLTRCANDTIQIPAQIIGDTPPYIISWTPQTGLSDPTVINPFAFPTKTTRYFVQVINGACVSHDSIDVRFVPDLKANIMGDTGIICRNQSLILTGTGGLGSPTMSWEPKISLSTSKGDEVTASPTITTIYTLTVKEAGCTDTATYLIKVLPTPIMDFEPSYNSGCENLTVAFNDMTKDATNWIWDFGDGSPLSNEENPTHVYPKPGVYNVTLRAQGLGGCPEKTEFKRAVTVGQTAKAYYNASVTDKDTLYLPETNVWFRDSSINAVSWYWNFGDGQASTDPNPAHRYERPGLYDAELTVRDTNGCVNSYKRVFLIMEPTLSIPNVFTPGPDASGGDGVNDVWHIPYRGVESFRVAVFDRWGNEVFISNDKNFGWDGGTVPSGVYFYMVKIGNKEIDGSVTVLRDKR